jgi:hypothetical protein
MTAAQARESTHPAESHDAPAPSCHRSAAASRASHAGAGAARTAMQRLLLASALALLISCVSRNEVSRVPSPNGALDAVLIQSNNAANTAFAYDVYVVKRGATLGRSPAVMVLDGALRGNDAYGVSLRWIDSSDLAVEYLAARKVTLTSGSVHVEDTDIRITPRSGVSDPSALPGGMPANSRRAPEDHRS